MSNTTDNTFFEIIGDFQEDNKIQEADNIRCEICGTNFTSNVYFERHKGTLKHKRNRRSRLKEVYNKGLEGQAEKNLATLPDLNLSQSSTRENGDNALYGSSCYRGVREKYYKGNRKNFESAYSSYVWSVTAYWAINLVVNPTVKDFKISLNNKKFGDFGDVVIEVEFIDYPEKPSITTTYAIQFKHIISSSVRSIDSFSENSFSIHSIISKIGKLNSTVDIKSTKFVLFTTAEVAPTLDPNVNVLFCEKCFKVEHQCNCLTNEENTKSLIDVHFFAKPLSTRRVNIIDTADNSQSIYSLISTKSQYDLPKIYFYTTQKHPRYFPESIDKKISEKLIDTQVQISRDFIKYIENWSEGRAGGCYKLKREDTLVKLGDLLLPKNFRETPKFKPIKADTKFNVWMQAINSVDITVLNQPVNLSKICEANNLIIQKMLELQINITDNTVKFLKTDISNPILKSYVFETLKNLDQDVHIEEIYLIFWKAGLIPMFLQVRDLKDQEYLIQVINMLKCLGLTRKYFIKTPDVNIKAFLKKFKILNAFVTLDDVAEKLPESYLNELGVSVTDNFSLSLKSIRNTDIFFQKNISATDFFDMALGKYMFRPAEHFLPENETEELKLILDKDIMSILKKEIESKLNGILEPNSPTHNGFLHGLDPNIFV